MFKENVTDEQKYWYLKGYTESLINNISIDMGIPEKKVRKWVIESLLDKIEVGDDIETK